MELEPLILSPGYSNTICWISNVRCIYDGQKLTKQGLVRAYPCGRRPVWRTGSGKRMPPLSTYFPGTAQSSPNGPQIPNRCRCAYVTLILFWVCCIEKDSCGCSIAPRCLTNHRRDLSQRTFANRKSVYTPLGKVLQTLFDGTRLTSWCFSRVC